MIPSRMRPFKNAAQHSYHPDEQIPRPLCSEEDGAHQPAGDKFFEWWYFDAHFDQEYRFVVVLHRRLFNVSTRPSVIAVHLYGPDDWKAVEVGTFKRSETTAEEERCDVRLGASRAWDAGTYYALHVEQGSIRASLKYRNEIAGVKMGTGSLSAGLTDEHALYWIVPVPRAQVSGQLWINNETISVQGIGYHDHNWGNGDFHQIVHQWIWGRFVTEAHTLIFWKILYRDPAVSHKSGAVLWKDSDLWRTTDHLDLHMLQPDRATSAASDCVDRIKWPSRNDEFTIHGSLHHQLNLETIEFVQPRVEGRTKRRVLENVSFISDRIPYLGQLVKRWIGYGSYSRWRACCTLKLGVESYGAQGMYEIMNFGDLK